MPARMKLSFTKMHGLGNDFMVINNLENKFILTGEQIQKLCDRRFGVGCDQLLMLEKINTSDHIDFFYRIYNADGSESGQCGNGARCLAKYIQDKKLSLKKTLRVQTQTTLLNLTLLDDQNIQVDMGIPQNIQELHIQKHTGIRLNMGNPHVVFIRQNITEISREDFSEFAQSTQKQKSIFPESVNVSIMQIKNPEHIALRVYERGAGETLACGSGACAAVVAGVYQGVLKAHKNIAVDLPGGRLQIKWAGDNMPVIMTGPAVSVFEGEIEI